MQELWLLLAAALLLLPLPRQMQELWLLLAAALLLMPLPLLPLVMLLSQVP